MSGAAGFMIIWVDDEGKERAHRLEPGDTVVGRVSPIDPWRVYLKDAGGEVDMGIEDPTVSRYHAVFHLDGDKLTVEDHGTRGEGSRNGTFVNGRRLEPRTPAPVEPGDEVRVGRYMVLRVARMEDKPTLPVKPGQTIIIDANKAETLPEELLRKSISLGSKKIALVIDEYTPKKSIDLGDKKIRPEYNSAEYRQNPLEKVKVMLSSMDSSLAEGLRLVEKGIDKRDDERLRDGVGVITGFLRQKRIAGISIQEIFDDMGVSETVSTILVIGEAIVNGRADEPQIRKFVTLVREVQHAVRARIRMLG